MLGILTPEQIVHVLQSEMIGRIGCYADGRVYVVPVSYAYHEGCIYAHSREGLKVHMMRQNPSVCFEVDQMENMANWCSVIVWGRYEELRNPLVQKEAQRILDGRLTPYASSETVSPFFHAEFPEKPHLVEKPMKPVMYRINIIESSGRFEKQISAA